MLDILMDYFLSLQQTPSLSETLIHLIPLIIGVFLIFYFVVISPTAKEEAKKKELIDKLKKGEVIVLSSGIWCKFIQHEESCSIVEIAPNVRVKVDKNVIARIPQ